jgi:hypothetical protein
VRDGAVTIVDGDYATYEQRAHIGAANGAPPAAVVTASAAAARNDKRQRAEAHETKHDAQRRKRAVAEAEKRVADLDAERAALEVRFTAADLYDDPAAVVELQRDLDRVRAAIDDAMAAWEAATAAAEGNS